MRRGLLTRLVLLYALAIAGCRGESVPPERIVLVVIDTLRADHVWPYGEGAVTPNLRALGERGQVFPNVWSSYHQTTMSMTALFTGRTPSLETGDAERSLPWTGANWCGLRRFQAPSGGDCVPESLPTLAAALRDAGYWTAAISTNSLLFRPAGYDRGFDVWVEIGEQIVDPQGRLPPGVVLPQDRTAELANRALAQVLAERPSDRFFLYVHYMDVHDYVLRRRPYARAVTVADAGFGNLMELLRSKELLEGSIVFATSDHGERLGEEHLVEGRDRHFGNPSFEEVLRVPLIVAPPRFEDTDRFLRSEDVHRLILEVAGLAAQPERDTEPEELFLSEAVYQTYRAGRWKSFRRRGSAEVHLLDLDKDPGERENAAARHPGVVAAHRARMDALTRALAAPDAPASELTPDDERRLRELGYFE